MRAPFRAETPACLPAHPPCLHALLTSTRAPGVRRGPATTAQALAILCLTERALEKEEEDRAAAESAGENARAVPALQPRSRATAARPEACA